MNVDNLINLVVSLESTYEILSDVTDKTIPLDEHHNKLISQVIQTDTEAMGINPENVIPALSGVGVSVEGMLGEIGSAIGKGLSTAIKVIISLFKSVFATIGKGIDFVKDKISKLGKAIAVLRMKSDSYVQITNIKTGPRSSISTDSIRSYVSEGVTALTSIAKVSGVATTDKRPPIIDELIKMRPFAEDYNGNGTADQKDITVMSAKQAIALVEQVEKISKLLTEINVANVLKIADDVEKYQLSTEELTKLKGSLNSLHYLSDFVKYFSISSIKDQFDKQYMWQQALDNESDDYMFSDGSYMDKAEEYGLKMRQDAISEMYSTDIKFKEITASVNGDKMTVSYAKAKSPYTDSMNYMVRITLICEDGTGQPIKDVINRKSPTVIYYNSRVPPQAFLPSVNLADAIKPLAKKMKADTGKDLTVSSAHVSAFNTLKSKINL